MKSQKSKVTGLIVAAILMITGTNLQAQNDGPPQRQEREKPVMHQRGPQGKHTDKDQRGIRIPNLNEEQKAQLKAIHLKTEKEALPLKNKVGEKEARLKTLTTSEKFDVRAVNLVIDEIGSLKSDLMKFKVAAGQEIKQILTEEQLVFFNNHAGKEQGPQHGRRR